MSEASWDGHTASELSAALGVPVHLYESLPSTMDIAHDLARAGAAPLTTVLTDIQTAGRGRGAHTWSTRSGSSVAVSIILRPTAAAVGVLSVRLALRLASTLDPYSSAGTCLIKWPNDLMLAGHGEHAGGKAGGVLVEARWRDGALEWAVVGVGLNRSSDVHPGAAAFDGTRLELLSAVVKAAREPMPAGDLSLEELEAWRHRDWARGLRASAPVPGVVRGLRNDGALLIDTGTEVRACLSGSLILEDMDAPRI